MALMDNSDMYQEYKGATGNAAAGTLDAMNQEYAESLAGRTQKLSTTLEGIFNNIFNTDSFYPFIDVAQKALDLIDNLTEAMGGGIPIITALTSALVNLFSKNLAQQINDTRINNAVQKQRQENYQNAPAALTQLGLANPNPEDQNSQAILNYAQELNRLSPNLSNEQLAEGNKILQEMVQNANAATKAQNELDTQMTALGTTIRTIFGEDSKYSLPFVDDDGIVNTSNFRELLNDFNEAGLKDIFKGSKEEIQNTLSELQNFNTALQLMRDAARDAEGEENHLNEALQLGYESLSQLKNSMPTADYQKLENAFKNFSDSLTQTQGDLDETGDSIDDLTVDVAELIETLLKLAKIDLTPEQIEQMLERANQASFAQKNGQSAAEDSQKVGAAYINTADQQLMTQSVLDTVGALGQLASAIMTVQNLGSI